MLCVALITGRPGSETTTTTDCVLGDWAMAGRQVTTPLLALANKKIADVLHITEYNVKDHLKHILGKLRVADRTEAVTVAIQRGIIHLP